MGIYNTARVLPLLTRKVSANAKKEGKMRGLRKATRMTVVTEVTQVTK